jgi:hypothetical protein
MLDRPFFLIVVWPVLSLALPSMVLSRFFLRIELFAPVLVKLLLLG